VLQMLLVCRPMVTSYLRFGHAAAHGFEEGLEARQVGEETWNLRSAGREG